MNWYGHQKLQTSPDIDVAHSLTVEEYTRPVDHTATSLTDSTTSSLK
jgi:hypothetical protein